MRFLPYIIGLFMLAPFALWAGFYLAFPGPKPGLDVPVVTALLAISLPLAAYHYIAGLAYVANSIAGRPGEIVPDWKPARWLMRAMPAATGVLAIGASALLWRAGEGAGAALATLAGGLAIAALLEHLSRAPSLSLPRLDLAHLLHQAMRGLGHGLLAVPVLGWMLREARRDPHRGIPLLVLNLGLALGLATAVFGMIVPMAAAMLSVPLVFYALFALTGE
ncbi:hypothetical protein E5163_08665 [Marinicauda algicola]|uniref:Uncharacterized protein n=1 Tax=Marinicauda algicola TaxID=2029849 RepID=A0A4S2H1Z0_9PROT|nr:hypothetical protein [Marinicauda algicola]TGY89182.1 hypothetical protein E5163_08665 [Marinicauda algicola]